jgi:hypothetical protein
VNVLLGSEGHSNEEHEDFDYITGLPFRQKATEILFGKMRKLGGGTRNVVLALSAMASKL